MTQTSRDRKKETPVYRIYPLVNGTVTIGGDLVFRGGDPDETYTLVCYIWLVLGGAEPMVVCAGLNDVEQLNREAEHVLRSPCEQRDDETVRSQLGKFGLAPEDIRHVFITHLHFDHVDALDDYPHAKVYIGQKEWDAAADPECVDRWGNRWGNQRIINEFISKPQWKERLVLVEDQELLCGVESFWVGGHTPGSMAYCFHTESGRTVLAGDLVSVMANITRDIPPGINMDEQQCLDGYQKIRDQADVILPSHDPFTLQRWPILSKCTPKYTVRAIKVGQCEVTDNISFFDGEETQTHTYYLYIWLIEGGKHPILVDTGPNPEYLEQFNQKTSQYIPGGIQQTKQENTLNALKRHGIEPGDIGHVIVTHLHEDHYNYFDAFPQARLVVNKLEFEDQRSDMAPHIMDVIRSRPDCLQLVEDEMLMSGIETVNLGSHTPGSQGILIQTWMGKVLITGDVSYLYENIESNRPARNKLDATEADREESARALAKIRSLADIVLPAHDPLTLERWPQGIIGGLQRTQ